jgi:CHAT domain-containing protein
VLHLATHGVVTSDTCADLESGARGVGGLSALAGGVRPAARPRPNQRPGSAKDPAGTSHSFWMGRRVWLALAGANRALEHHQDENEGLLTAEEVVTLDLQDAEWVVLSACHSGLAERWSREGAVGMRRAFHMAGARTVIAGQWSLDDQAAREWMEGLYAARMDGASAAAAITSANRRILTERRKAGRTTHPFYWASIVPSGD